MDFRRGAFLLTLFLAACLGCRGQQHAQRELLERELRLQEDRIYELEAKLEDATVQLKRLGGDACPAPSGFGDLQFTAPPTSSTLTPDISRPLNSSSPSRSTTSPAPASTPAPNTPAPHTSVPPHDTAPPVVELPTDAKKVIVPPFSGAPTIAPPDPSVPEGLPSRTTPPAAPNSVPNSPPSNLPEPLPSQTLPAAPTGPVIKEMSSPKFRSPSGGLRRDAAPSTAPEMLPQAGPDVQPADTAVTAVSIARRTAGYNTDGKTGDDGLLIVLEPRNARGEIVADGGEVSLVLIDPAIVGEGGRYARWDFTADDAAATYRPPLDGNPAGLYFELPWPDAQPAHPRLKLFVRYTTRDGRRLQADRDVTVQLNPQAAAAAAQMFLPPTGEPPVSTPIATPIPTPVLLPAGAMEAAPYPNAAHSNAAGQVVPAAPQAPLKWGGPKVSLTRPEPLPTMTESTAAPLPAGGPAAEELQMPPVPTLDNLLQGPALGSPDGR